MKFFQHFSACLEYNFVIYSLNKFKFDMHDCWNIMESIAQDLLLPSTNFELFFPIWPSFL